MDIEPGAPLSIEVIATPKRVAARKTLERVCAKDPAVAKRHRVQKAKRPSRQEWIRGGKYIFVIIRRRLTKSRKA